MEYCLSLLYIVISYQAFIWCMDVFAARRYKKRVFAGISCALCLVLFLLLNVEKEVSIFPAWANILTNIVVFFTAFQTLYKSPNIAFGLLVTLLYYVIFYFITYAVYVLIAAFLKISIAELLTTYYPLIMAGNTAHLVVLFLSALFKRIHPKCEDSRIHWQVLLLMLLFPGASVTVLIEMLPISNTVPSYNKSVSICAISLVVANIAVLILFDWLEASADDREKKLALTQTVQLQEKNMEALGKAYSDQRKITHDYNAYLETIDGLLKENNIESAKQFIDNLRAKQTTRLLLVNSHHPIMDALLNQKAYAAKNNDIAIHFEINDLSKLEVNPVDMTAMLGNLLDNAIEACLAHKVDKQIQVKALLGKTFYFSIRNTCNPVKIVNDAIATTKPDAENHGCGIENVKAIIQKYNGEYAMEYENGWFLFAGEIPNISIS